MSIEIEHDGPVSSLILARPEARNAMSEAMGRSIEAAVAALNARDEARAVLVRGRGEAFCAGGDLAMIEARAASPPEANEAAMRAFYRLFLSIRALRVPTIAVVHGAAIGAGLCFAMACDLRVAAAGARMGLTFVRVGLHPGMGATWLLPRLVGPARAAELLLTGRTIDAEEALRIGLVNAVHPRDALLGEARALAAEIAAAAPIPVAQCKRTLDTAAGPRTLDEALDLEARAQRVDFATADVLEGVRAIRARRPPNFSGR